MTDSSPQTAALDLPPISAVSVPDTEVSVREVFGIDSDLKVPAFSLRTEHVPPIDTAYLFDHDTTLAILAGFALTVALWCRASMVRANRPMWSRLQRA